jgi:tripartite-type tricarboxylate transporter receptor subunit TctC
MRTLLKLGSCGGMPRCVVLAAAFLSIAGCSATAQPAEQFFKGKVINLYIGFAPGGTYDYYSRLFARFAGKHIPGNPTIVPQNMPGAGSFQAANFLYAVAPKDGTAMAMISQVAAIEEALQSPGIQFKTAEFNWIGRMSNILEVHFTWKTSKVKTIQDAREYEAPLAGTGVGSPSEGYPKLLNALSGTKFKVISGYPGSTQGMMAMERGEVDGALTSWHTLNRTKADWLRNRDINLLVQYAPARHSDLPDVPAVVELGKTPEANQVLGFYSSSAELGRSVVAPPGVPADRIKVLRTAFDAMLKDPEFRAEIEKSQLEFQPASGGEVQKLVSDTANVAKDIAEKTKAILRAR